MNKKFATNIRESNQKEPEVFWRTTHSRRQGTSLKFAYKERSEPKAIWNQNIELEHGLSVLKANSELTGPTIVRASSSTSCIRWSVMFWKLAYWNEHRDFDPDATTTFRRLKEILCVTISKKDITWFWCVSKSSVLRFWLNSIHGFNLMVLRAHLMCAISEKWKHLRITI